MDIDRQVERAKQLPASTQFAIVETLKNIPYGANWGLVLQEDIKPYVEELKNDKNLWVFPVAGGYVVGVSRSYLFSAVKAIDASMVTDADIKNFQDKAKQGVDAFDKFLTSRKGAGETLIGIFCTNLVTSIRHANADYPSFRVDLMTSLQMLAKYGYLVFKKQGGWTSPEALYRNPNELFDSLLMSPTLTGVFMKIKKA